MRRTEGEPQVTRTIYGVTPALTSEGRKSDTQIPLRVTLTDQTDRKIANALEHVRYLLPSDRSENAHEYVIDITQDVVAPQLEDGLRTPPEVYVSVGPNYGLLNKDGSKLGIRNPKHNRYGVAEIKAPVFAEKADQDEEHVIARDEDMRGVGSDVIFTGEFLKQVSRDSVNIGSVVKPEHRYELIEGYGLEMSIGDAKWVDPKESDEWNSNYPFKEVQLSVRLENPGMPTWEPRKR